MFQAIKNIFNNSKKVKLVRKGNCKQCGECCRQITFKVKAKFITSSEEFERLRFWQRHYNNFYISGKDENGTLLFTCKSLTKDGKCSVHFLRGLYCRIYPSVKTNTFFKGGGTIENCGYYFESNIKFDEFLK